MKKGTKTDNLSPLQETLAACKIMFKFILLFGFISNLLLLSTPLYSMQVLDRVISSGNHNTLLMLSLVIAGALLLLAFIQGARAFAVNKMGAWIEKRLSGIVYENSINISVNAQGKSTGSIQMRDLQTIKTYLTSPQVVSMLDMPWAILFIVVLFILHVYFGFIALIASLMLLGFGILSDRITSKLLGENNDNFVRSMNSVEQSTRNAEVINAMGLLPHIMKRWQRLNSRVQNTQNLANKRQALVTEATTFFRTLMQISVTGIGAILVIRGEITAGVIIASSSLMGRALAPFQVAIASWKGYIKFKKSYDRLENAFRGYKSGAESMELPTPKGALKAEAIYYAPPGAKKHTLRSVKFDLEPGETLVIIGASGSGKTTLARILVGALVPTNGSVRLDNAKLSDWDKGQLGEYLGYLPQDVELFAGTVRDNIARMEENPDAEKVIEAAQLAGVHDLILHLPNGYDTDVGANGAALSGGQRQRIGLARAFYGSPKFIVLDEPNSNLDNAGEEALALAVEVAKENKITTIIISHRTSIIGLADKIMVLNQGAISTYGTKREVLDKMNTLKSIGGSK